MRSISSFSYFPQCACFLGRLARVVYCEISVNSEQTSLCVLSKFTLKHVDLNKTIPYSTWSVLNTARYRRTIALQKPPKPLMFNIIKSMDIYIYMCVCVDLDISIIAIKIDNLLICFSNFDLSCPLFDFFDFF